MARIAVSYTETELAVIFTGYFESSRDGLWPKMMISTPFFLMMSSYDSVWSITQNEIFFLTILPLDNENKSLRTERCSITDRMGYITSNATWGVLGGFKRSRTKGLHPLSGEMSFGTAKLAIACIF